MEFPERLQLFGSRRTLGGGDLGKSSFFADVSAARRAAATTASSYAHVLIRR
jgi:hypothetical protein